MKIVTYKIRHKIWNNTSHSGDLQMVQPHALYRFYQRPTYWTHTVNNHIIKICHNLKSIVVVSCSYGIIICHFLNHIYICLNFCSCYVITKQLFIIPSHLRVRDRQMTVIHHHWMVCVFYTYDFTCTNSL